MMLIRRHKLKDWKGSSRTVPTTYYWPYGTIASFGYFLLKDYNNNFVKSRQQSFFIPDKTMVRSIKGE